MGPNLLIVGAPRAGTTALAHSLGQHPDVLMTDPKEPHYLALGDRIPQFTGPGDDATINRQIVHDRKNYLALFPQPASAAYYCDASVSTLYLWGSIGERSQLIAPDARFIVCLREPALRAYSAYLYLRSRGFEPEDFETGLRLESSRVAEGWHHMWHYSGCSRYLAQLNRLLQDVDRSRVYIMIAEELRADHAGETTRLLAWLGLPAQAPAKEAHSDVNRGGEAKNRAIGAAIATMSRRPALQAAARTLIPFSFRHRLKARMLHQPPIDQSLLAALRLVHAQDTERVVDLLGRQPQGW
jgi:hypothetical protein